ncbi:MAG: hypothetical protein AAF717_08140, partial [Bacteroidota bacterium]
MKKITLLVTLIFYSFVVNGQTCSPISTLDCSDVLVTLPVRLDFNSDVSNTLLDSNGLGTGFTAVMEHSEQRMSTDLQISDPNVNGYEPSLISLNSGVLEILSQGGISFLDPPASNNNNNQINTLGVGFDNVTEVIVIKSQLNNIVTGGSSAQAGIWFGYDEDNFVKLNVNNNNVELRVESNGLSNNSSQIQSALGASGNDVILELIIDPNTLTAEAYYVIGSGSRTLLGSLSIPTNYFLGRDINASGGQNNVSFAGIYATHRSGSQFTASFEEFSVEGPAPIAPISAPYRINVAGGDYTLNGELFQAEDTSYLVGTSQTSTGNYTVVGGNGELYIPRRFGP